MTTLSSEQLAQELADRTIAGYAMEHILLDGKPFEFQDHNYLLEPYYDTHPYIVVEKAAQMGASVLGMIRAFFVCDRMGKNVIYFFPTDEDVREFSKSRVAPIIRDSPHLRAIVDEVDSVGLRQIGRGFLYFRGMRSTIRMRSVPADMLVYDELDEVTDEQRALADQRLNHSKLRWRFMLSTPTYDGYGIDHEFRKSDQRYWNLICKKCDTLNIMEKQFPDCVRRVGESSYILVCRKCGGELDGQYGRWIPEKRIERVRGYHFCGLYSKFVDLADLMDEFNSGRRREEFFRSKLGLPWVSADQRITRDMVEACIGAHPVGPNPKYAHSFMGVDQKGDELHIVIRNRDNITRRPFVLFIGKVGTFADLDFYMRAYDIDQCVIDGLPNQHSARDFAHRFPGRVFLCYYNAKQKGAYRWLSPEASSADGPRDWQVTVDRTEAIDAMYEQITQREITLPQLPGEAARSEFLEQMVNLARVNEEDPETGVKRAMWKKLGAEHYAHAMSYSAIAASRYSGPAQSVNIRSPYMARTDYSRRYEQGSRF
ncbi:MAG: phage terminase large subunit family protein [Candidatus Dormibacteria bacterium]